MTRTFRHAALAALLSLAAATPAFAQMAQGPLSVSANVTKNCVVSTSPMAFGNVDVTAGTHFDAAAELTVRCTSGAAWTATAGLGLGTGASVGTRRMQNGGNLLGYTLYTDSGRTSVWGVEEGESSGVIEGVGTGADDVTDIYGRVFGGQSSLPSGTYQDTVQVTVSYL